MLIRKALLQNVYLEAVNGRRIDNTMVKDKNVKKKKVQTMIYKTLHRKLNI